MKFLSVELSLRQLGEYCCHVWAHPPSCDSELLDKLLLCSDVTYENLESEKSYYTLKNDYYKEYCH